MEKNNHDIATIEAYLRGEMAASEKTAFEAGLATDEALQKEVAAYRKIYSGFEGLKEEAFAAQVTQWTAEARMERLREPAVIRPLWQKLAVAASILLLISLSVGWLLSRQYTDAKLVAKAYVAPLASGTMGGQTPVADEITTQFEQGHAFFNNGDYANATDSFFSVIRGIQNQPEAFDSLTRKFYLENAQWTLLLAMFANGKMTEQQFSIALETIANDPTNEFADKAKALQGDLTSIWRKWAD